MSVSLEFLPPARTSTHRIEREIIVQLLVDLLKAGCDLSVNDGEETVLKHSEDFCAIVKAMFSTEEDYIFVFRAGKRLGFVRLIYGNGYDVISDSTDSAELDELLKGAQTLAESFQ